MKTIQIFKDLIDQDALIANNLKLRIELERERKDLIDSFYKKMSEYHSELNKGDICKADEQFEFHENEFTITYKGEIHLFQWDHEGGKVEIKRLKTIK